MASLERSAPGVSAPQPARSTGGLWEWFWRGKALASAKASARATVTRRERFRRAALATELADRQLESDDPLRAGSAYPLAVSLYREAAYWALLACSDRSSARDIGEAFGATPQETANAAGLSAEELAAVRATLVDETFVETADERPEVQQRAAELCQKFVHGLIDGADRTNVVSSVLLQRWLRIGLTLLIVLVASFSAKIAIQRWQQGPDLALGKPWRTSSTAYRCHPSKGECGGTQSAMFFHTTEEESPWIEFDLGGVQPVARIEVENRDDCCLDRAVPLVAEVSTDRLHWRKVARRADSFRSWDATFKPVPARYVRLRVDRYSQLHLVRVSVRAE
jgi:hypothetical protein